MGPIRIGFIGLSAAATGTGWAESAHLAHLLKHPEKFQITALLNSTVENAKAAIEKFKLAPTTKAYGKPEDLANDPDVDLVVCSVRVDRHYETLLPSVKAGKDAFSEWPLGADLKEAKELADVAKKTGAKTVVALQGHVSPHILQIKDIIQSGRIGKVLSTTWTGTGDNFGYGPTPSSVGYFVDKKVGGNLLTIQVAHTIDPLLFALGAEFTSFSSVLGNQRPEVQIFDKATGKNLEVVTKDTPDQILIHGRLSNGALVSYHLRGGKPSPGLPAMIWKIYGEKGEIIVTADGTSMMHISSLDISVHDFATDKVEKISVEDGDYADLAQPEKNIARLYDVYANGKWVPDWDWAVKRHALLDEMFEREENGTQDVPVKCAST